MKQVGWFGLSVSSGLAVLIWSLYGTPLLYKQNYTSLFARELYPLSPNSIKRSVLEPARNAARLAPWPAGELPHVAAGLAISVYATGLDRPRWLYPLPNGDILVAETASPNIQNTDTTHRMAERILNAATGDLYSANRITLLRDSNGSGMADVKTPFLRNMYLPFGMALIGHDFYVATADAITRYSYETGQTQITTPGTHLINLPDYNHDWEKNILASEDGRYLYITLNATPTLPDSVLQLGGSLLRLDLTTRTVTNYVTKLPTPVGLAQDPQSGLLWVVLDDFKALETKKYKDYLTSTIQDMAWVPPPDTRNSVMDRRILPRNAMPPPMPETTGYALGSYTGALALVFSYDSTLPEALRHGLFVSERGSWAHKPKHGYKIVYIPFENGKPSGKPQDIVNGFLSPEETQLYGRPVGLCLDASGALLVADDVGNIIWRITAAQTEEKK